MSAIKPNPNGARLSGVIVDLPLINTDEALMENEVGRAVPGEPRSLVAPWFKVQDHAWLSGTLRPTKHIQEEMRPQKC